MHTYILKNHRKKTSITRSFFYGFKAKYNRNATVEKFISCDYNNRSNGHRICANCKNIFRTLNVIPRKQTTIYIKNDNSNENNTMQAVAISSKHYLHILGICDKDPGNSGEKYRSNQNFQITLIADKFFPGDKKD